MRYFLTGATGFIGGRLATFLRTRGHDVVALVRSPEKAQALAEQGVILAKGDVTDCASLKAAMPGCDGVFHVAGWYKIGPGARSDEGVRVNVEGTRHVLEAMRELGIPKGVYTSTLAVFSDTHGALPDESYRYDGSHLSEYDRTKAQLTTPEKRHIEQVALTTPEAEKAFDDAKASDAMIGIANAQDALGDRRSAQKTLEGLLAKYPQSPAAASARQRLQQGTKK